MKIEFLRDPEQKETKIVVVASEQNEKTQALVDELERMLGDTVKAYDGDRICILKEADLLRVYSEGQRVFCQTDEGIFALRSRLYEMEETLDPNCFVRISKCEIVNVRRILHLDVALTGTIGITLEGNVKTYTSRRYMSKLKAIFGLGREEKQ